jgi:hypothetical protein
MTTQESKILTQEILEYAHKAKPAEFRFIRTRADYKFFIGQRRTTKLLIRSLYEAANRLFRQYCAKPIEGDSYIKLVACNQIQEVIKFYEHELEVLKDMIYEYEAYLMEGHWLSAFLGSVRPEEDLRDFRE